MSATSVLSRASGQLCLRSTVALRGGYSLARSQDSAVIRAPALSALARYYASKSFPPHTVVSMPALSPTMTAGNIGAWQKKVGEAIAPGDVLVEIETDKAQMDFEYQEEGVLAKVLKDSGEKDVSVGSPIAVLVEEGEDVSAFESFSIEDAGGAKQGSKEELPSKEAPRESRESRSQESAEEITAPAKAESEAVESDSTGAELEPSLDREPKISPAARKLALEKGVPIGSIKGSGPGGRIVAEDIEKFKPTGGASSGPAAAGGAPSYEDVTASGMRKTIANRLTQSWQTNPHYFVASSISVTKLMKLRVALNTSANGEYKLSVNDFLIKACAIACRKVPAANSAWIEENGQVVIRQNNIVDVAVAVATPSGLITPIVKNVNGLGLESISSQMKDLGKRARDNKLKPEEYQGGTVTISNMGMNDAIDRFTAVINPPGATIIAIGAPKKVAIPVKNEETGETEVGWDDQIVITGSFDHKVVDGAVGGEFMKELKKVVENPLSLLL